jgi:L-aspartate oxidase
MNYDCDILVIGSGIGGLYFALMAAQYGKVAVITKKKRWEAATNLAQGGIASVVSKSDSFKHHIDDTLKAGDGLCDRKIVEKAVKVGPDCIAELDRMGVEFSRPEGKDDFDLGSEGGHSRKRVVHAADFTGRAIEQALVHATRNHQNIELFEHHYAIDLITQHHLKGNTSSTEKPVCFGAYVLDIEKRMVETFRAKFTMLATGGGGRIYHHTTNPDIATADGIAMAFLAGARIGNLEFVQFHPTALYHSEEPSFLISEAVRGEGGRLILKSGEGFMKRYHEKAELAPRDIVARAIDSELKRTGDQCVYLDVTHLGKSFLERRFPTIYWKCESLEIDISKEPIPVVPSAHYFCGGVVADEYGRTDIQNLYVCGEVAMTGMHGANRLASNSLLEAVAFARFSSESLGEVYDSVSHPADIPPWDESGVFDTDEWVVISHDKNTLTRLMWDYVGIVRSDNRLRKAAVRCQIMSKDIIDFYRKNPVRSDVIELRNMAIAAKLLIHSARSRKESRGLHYNIDYPKKDDKNWNHNTIVKQGDI